MFFRPRALFLSILLLLLCVSCGTPREMVDKMEDVSFKPPVSTNPPAKFETERILPAEITDPPSESFSLPSPSEALRLSSAAANPLFQRAVDYVQPANETRLQSTGGVLSFQPDWSAANPGLDRLAYASFRPNVAGYSGPATVYTEWLNLGLPVSNLYIALANFELDRWQWFQGSYDSALDVGSFADYSTDSGEMIIVVALTGSSLNSLSFLRVGENILPDAQILADVTEGEAPLLVSFNAGASSDSETELRPSASPLSYSWDAEGDGIFEGGPAPSPLFDHSYSSNGSYEATVRVTDSEGGFSDASVTIEVGGSGGGNEAPTAGLSALPLSGPAPLEVQFDASLSSDSDGSIELYEWDYTGDGTYESSTLVPQSSHTYTLPGQFNAIVRVTDDDGATDTANLEINVGDGDQAPVAVISSDFYFGDAPLNVVLDGSASTDPDNDIALYDWDLDGNGTFETSSGTNPFQPASFAASGSHTVGLRVTDENDNSSSATTSVIADDGESSYDETEVNNEFSAANALPLLQFNGWDGNLGEGGYDGSRDDWYSFVATADTAVTISMLFIDAEADLDMQLIDSDGSTILQSSTGVVDNEEIIYGFSEGGTYYLRCFVYSGAPADAMADYTLAMSQSILVPPTASFTATPDSGAAPLEVSFDASASSDTDGTIVKYEWDYNGDGVYELNGGTSPTAEATFYRGGSFNVVLRVTDDSGASDTANHVVTVSSDPGDEQENNDTDAEANEFPAFPFSGFIADLGPGGDDGDTEDWYSFTLSQQETVDILMTFHDPFGDLDMKLYHYVGDVLTEVGTSTGTDDDEQITELLQPDTYYLKCYVYNPTGGGYGGYRLAASTI